MHLLKFGRDFAIAVRFPPEAGESSAFLSFRARRAAWERERGSPPTAPERPAADVLAWDGQAKARRNEGRRGRHIAHAARDFVGGVDDARCQVVAQRADDLRFNA